MLVSELQVRSAVVDETLWHKSRKIGTIFAFDP
jgi:hypothetical protein